MLQRYKKTRKVPKISIFSLVVDKKPTFLSTTVILLDKIGKREGGAASTAVPPSRDKKHWDISYIDCFYLVMS